MPHVVLGAGDAGPNKEQKIRPHRATFWRQDLCSAQPFLGVAAAREEMEGSGETLMPGADSRPDRGQCVEPPPGQEHLTSPFVVGLMGTCHPHPFPLSVPCRSVACYGRGQCCWPTTLSAQEHQNSWHMCATAAALSAHTSPRTWSTRQQWMASRRLSTWAWMAQHSLDHPPCSRLPCQAWL